MCASTGNIEVVAPSSAPMLAIVALPVALNVRAPGPMYSTIAFVPPDTVSSPATQRITSLGAAQPSGEDHRNALRIEHLPREAGDHFHGIRAADADGAGAEATGIRRVRIR